MSAPNSGRRSTLPAPITSTLAPRPAVVRPNPEGFTNTIPSGDSQTTQPATPTSPSPSISRAPYIPGSSAKKDMNFVNISPPTRSRSSSFSQSASLVSSVTFHSPSSARGSNNVTNAIISSPPSSARGAPFPSTITHPRTIHLGITKSSEPRRETARNGDVPRPNSRYDSRDGFDGKTPRPNSRGNTIEGRPSSSSLSSRPVSRPSLGGTGALTSSNQKMNATSLSGFTGTGSHSSRHNITPRTSEKPSSTTSSDSTTTFTTEEPINNFPNHSSLLTSESNMMVNSRFSTVGVDLHSTPLIALRDVSPLTSPAPSRLGQGPNPRISMAPNTARTPQKPLSRTQSIPDSTSIPSSRRTSIIDSTGDGGSSSTLSSRRSSLSQSQPQSGRQGIARPTSSHSKARVYFSNPDLRTVPVFPTVSLIPSDLSKFTDVIDSPDSQDFGQGLGNSSGFPTCESVELVLSPSKKRITSLAVSTSTQTILPALSNTVSFQDDDRGVNFSSFNDQTSDDGQELIQENSKFNKELQHRDNVELSNSLNHIHEVHSRNVSLLSGAMLAASQSGYWNESGRLFEDAISDKSQSFIDEAETRAISRAAQEGGQHTSDNFLHLFKTPKTNKIAKNVNTSSVEENKITSFSPISSTSSEDLRRVGEYDISSLLESPTLSEHNDNSEREQHEQRDHFVSSNNEYEQNSSLVSSIEDEMNAEEEEAEAARIIAMVEKEALLLEAQAKMKAQAETSSILENSIVVEDAEDVEYTYDMDEEAEAAKFIALAEQEAIKMQIEEEEMHNTMHESKIIYTTSIEIEAAGLSMEQTQGTQIAIEELDAKRIAVEEVESKKAEYKHITDEQAETGCNIVEDAEFGRIGQKGVETTRITQEDNIEGECIEQQKAEIRRSVQEEIRVNRIEAESVAEEVELECVTAEIAKPNHIVDGIEAKLFTHKSGDEHIALEEAESFPAVVSAHLNINNAEEAFLQSEHKDDLEGHFDQMNTLYFDVVGKTVTLDTDLKHVGEDANYISSTDETNSVVATDVAETFNVVETDIISGGITSSVVPLPISTKGNGINVDIKLKSIKQPKAYKPSVTSRTDNLLISQITSSPSHIVTGSASSVASTHKSSISKIRKSTTTKSTSKSVPSNTNELECITVGTAIVSRHNPKSFQSVDGMDIDADIEEKKDVDGDIELEFDENNETETDKKNENKEIQNQLYVQSEEADSTTQLTLSALLTPSSSSSMEVLIADDLEREDVVLPLHSVSKLPQVAQNKKDDFGKQPRISFVSTRSTVSNAHNQLPALFPKSTVEMTRLDKDRGKHPLFGGVVCLHAEDAVPTLAYCTPNEKEQFSDITSFSRSNFHHFPLKSSYSFTKTWKFSLHDLDTLKMAYNEGHTRSFAFSKHLGIGERLCVGGWALAETFVGVLQPTFDPLTSFLSKITYTQTEYIFSSFPQLEAGKKSLESFVNHVTMVIQQSRQNENLQKWFDIVQRYSEQMGHKADEQVQELGILISPYFEVFTESIRHYTAPPITSVIGATRWIHDRTVLAANNYCTNITIHTSLSRKSNASQRKVSILACEAFFNVRKAMGVIYNEIRLPLLNAYFADDILSQIASTTFEHESTNLASIEEIIADIDQVVDTNIEIFETIRQESDNVIENIHPESNGLEEKSDERGAITRNEEPVVQAESNQPLESRLSEKLQDQTKLSKVGDTDNMAGSNNTQGIEQNLLLERSDISSCLEFDSSTEILQSLDISQAKVNYEGNLNDEVSSKSDDSLEFLRDEALVELPQDESSIESPRDESSIKLPPIESPIELLPVELPIELLPVESLPVESPVLVTDVDNQSLVRSFLDNSIETQTHFDIDHLSAKPNMESDSDINSIEIIRQPGDNINQILYDPSTKSKTDIFGEAFSTPTTTTTTTITSTVTTFRFLRRPTHTGLDIGWGYYITTVQGWFYGLREAVKYVSDHSREQLQVINSRMLYTFALVKKNYFGYNESF